jgi:hypothetical protein
MASLADLILTAPDVDDLEVDDEDVIRELEELSKLRAAVDPENRSVIASRLPTPAKAISASSQDKRPLSGGYSKPTSETPVSGGYSKPSLADKILSASDGVDDIDKEFQAMEQELQQQLLKYKEQCQGAEQSPAEKASAAAGGSDPRTAGGTSGPSRPSSKSSAVGKEPASATVDLGASTTGDEILNPEIAAPELVSLRAEVAQMEEAFPEVEPENQDAENRPVRHRRIRRVDDSRREDVPEDAETAEMKAMLSKLDSRMNTIQQKHAVCDPLQQTASTGLTPAASRAISELQAQNAHLLERFQTSGKRGLLKLDMCMFGAADKQAKGAGPVSQPESVVANASPSLEQAMETGVSAS